MPALPVALSGHALSPAAPLFSVESFPSIDDHSSVNPAPCAGLPCRWREDRLMNGKMLLHSFLTALGVLVFLGQTGTSLWAQERTAASLGFDDQAGSLRLTLTEARQRVLANSKAMQLAQLQVEQKGYARKAMQTYYLPKFIGSYAYLHFNNPLGTVISTKGPFLPDIPVNVINQDASVGAIIAAQPVTGLLKVREGVKAAKADEQIALAQVNKATRLLTSGVEQLYLGLVAAQRLR